MNRFNVIFNPKYEKVLFALPWVLPLISVVISEVFSVDGPERYWCWLTEEHVIARVLLFDVPLLLILALDLLVYAKMFRNVHIMKQESHNVNEADSSGSSKKTQFMFRISIFLVVYFLCWIWVSLDDLSDAYSPRNSDIILNICAFITPLQGFINAFIYGWTFHRKLFHYIRVKIGLSSSRSTQLNTNFSDATHTSKA